MTTFETVDIETQFKNFFYVIGKSRFIREIFNILYFKLLHQRRQLWDHDEHIK